MTCCSPSCHSFTHPSIYVPNAPLFCLGQRTSEFVYSANNNSSGPGTVIVGGGGGARGRNGGPNSGIDENRGNTSGELHRHPQHPPQASAETRSTKVLSDTSSAMTASDLAAVGSVAVFDIVTQRILAHFHAHSQSLSALAFDPSGSLVGSLFGQRPPRVRFGLTESSHAGPMHPCLLACHCLY